MGNEHMKRCMTSFVIKEMQINTTMRYHYTQTRITIIKKTGPSVSKESEKSEHLRIADGNIKQYTTSENILTVSLKVIHTFTISPSNTMAMNLSMRKHMSTQRQDCE